MYAALAAMATNMVGVGVKAAQANSEKKRLERERASEEQRYAQQFDARQAQFANQTQANALYNQMAGARAGGSAAGQAAGMQQAMARSPQLSAQASVLANDMARGYMQGQGDYWAMANTINRQNVDRTNAMGNSALFDQLNLVNGAISGVGGIGSELYDMYRASQAPTPNQAVQTSPAQTVAPRVAPQPAPQVIQPPPAVLPPEDPDMKLIREWAGVPRGY